MSNSVFYAALPLYTIVPLAALLILIGFWLYTVIRLQGAVRGWLTAVGIIVFALAAVLFGWHWLLRQYELTWRFWLKMLLAMLLWCAGLAVCVLTVWHIPRIVNKEKPGIRGVLCTAATLCLVIVMGFGTVWGGFWISPVTEEVTVYRGEKVVEETSHWLDHVRVVYEYRGPFVRGAKPIGPIGG